MSKLSWAKKPDASEATTAEGYRITWANAGWCVWHNAWSPDGKCIGAGKKDDCKAACETHFQQHSSCNNVSQQAQLEL